MKRLLNISFLLMMLFFNGCQRAKSPDNVWGIRPVGQDSAVRPFTVESLEPIAAPPLGTTTGVTPSPLKPKMVAVDETGGCMVSMIYPSEDYGIIQIDKTMPREVGLNQLFDYSIMITNLTNVTLTDVVVTEHLPNDFEFTGASPTAQKEANRLVWKIDLIQAKATKQIIVSGMGTRTDNLENRTTVTYAIDVRANVKVVQPKLELTVTAPTDILLTDQITVRFVVANTGSGSAQNVRIVDTLPAGLQTIDGKSELVFEIGTLLAGQVHELTAQLRAIRTGIYVHKAIASSVTGLMAESAATVTTVRQPRLSIVKTGPTRHYLGRPLSFEITVNNRGDGPARDTVLEDTIPAGATSIEATAGAELTGSKLFWKLGTLESNDSRTVRVSYIPTRVGAITDTATVNAYCAETASASTRTLITGIAAARLDVIDLEDPIEVGHNTTYVITVTNQGTAADTNIRIVCALEDKVQFVSTVGATSGSLMGNTVSFAPLHSLEPKARATWRVVVKGVRPGDVRFRVTMSSDQLTRPVEQTEATHLYD